MKTAREIVSILSTKKDAKVVDVGDDGMAFAWGKLLVVVSWGGGWDHVSISLATRVPRWAEMERIKRLCFLRDEWAYQLHAPPSAHINVHPNCLHLWRCQTADVPVPPKEFV